MTKHTPGPWIAKLYKAEKDGRPEWGVRQSPDAPSVSVDGEVLPCGFSICNIVAQDMEDIENGEERANAALIAAAPELLEVLRDVRECQYTGKGRCPYCERKIEAAFATIEPENGEKDDGS